MALGFHATDTRGEGKLLDRAEKPFPLARRQSFGVIDLAKERRQGVWICGQDHCRGDHRSRPRPAPGFIDTRDCPIPGRPQLGLHGESWRDPRGQPGRARRAARSRLANSETTACAETHMAESLLRESRSAGTKQQIPLPKRGYRWSRGKVTPNIARLIWRTSSPQAARSLMRRVLSGEQPCPCGRAGSKGWRGAPWRAGEPPLCPHEARQRGTCAPRRRRGRRCAGL